MVRILLHKSAPWRWLFCMAGCVVAACSAQGQYDPDWASHFRIGPMVGFNIKADFSTVGNIPINHAAGVYDDGYVHPPPPGSADDVTSNWGYNNSTQVSGQTLLMHRTTSFSLYGSAGENKNAPPLPGFDLAYGGNLWYWGRARIGWDFGFGLLPINLSVNESELGNANQSTFSFNTGPDTSVLLANGLLPPGYKGTPNPGPGIFSTPTQGNSAANPNATLTGSQSLDVMLYTFRLGPSVYWDFSRYVGMSVGAGPALGLVSGDLKFDEFIQTSTVAENKGQVNGTDLVYGWYANATVMYHVMKNGDIFLSGQYMPMGTATLSGQGRQGRLDLRGAAYISAGFNWPF